MNEVWISQDRLLQERQPLNLEQDRTGYSWNYRSRENAEELKIIYMRSGENYSAPGNEN